MSSEFQQVLNQGGPILWALILLGVGLYTILASTWLGLWRVKSELVDHDFINQGRRQTESHFAVYELDRLAWVERRIPFIGVLAGAAPLTGLLGTVSGMLVTFSGLATSSVATPIDKISMGISEALITTQAGLLLAIPAAFLLAILRSQTKTTRTMLQQKLHKVMVADAELSNSLA